MFLEKAKRGYNQWFLYVFTLVVVFLGVQVGSIPVTAYALAAAGGDLTTAAEGLTLPRTNAGLALTLLAFAVGVAVLLFCVVKIHRKRWTDTLTGWERFDWGRVGFGAAVWGALSVAFLFLQYGTGDTSHLEWQFEAGPFAGMCAVLVLLMPFQVGFEEWVFRGYLMQGCALLFKRGWAAIAVTGVVFGLMHGANPEVAEFGFWVAMPQYIVMGLVLGTAAVLDDGVELAFGLHLANNLLSSIVVTHEASALQTHALFVDTQPSMSAWDGAVMLACGVVFLWACNQKYHFWGKVNVWGRLRFS